mgnify:CR=1 FL=1
MLPFLKKNQEASVSVTSPSIERKPDHDEHELDYLEECAGELIAAIKSGNKKAVAQALQDFFVIAESMPHEEGEHV